MATGLSFIWLSLFSVLFYVTIISCSPFRPSLPLATSITRPGQRLTAVSSTKNEPYKTKFYTQTLDHFNFHRGSYKTFQQRYLLNDSFWGGASSNSPIFVYMGNEGDIEWFAQNTGFMFEVAPRFKALLVFIEHRFYGQSIPFGGIDVAYNNSKTLGYLSSTQALADYATLITDLKTNLTAMNSPVLVIGGSYGGMLAAWFRLKYPHVAIGALASSAPILYFDNMTSPYGFYDVVSQNFKDESEDCYKVIKESWQQIEEIAAKGGGLEELSKSFKLCRKNTTADAVEGWLNEAYVYAAMTNYPTPSNFLKPLPAYPVREMCKAIDNLSNQDDKLAKLYGAANIYYNYTGTATCFDLGGDLQTDDLGQRGWNWQACTEMEMPMSCSEQSMFPPSEWNNTGNEEHCREIYGVKPRRHWIATQFGGHNIRRVLRRSGSNIIFFNGMRDPWSAGGVLERISHSIITIIAKEGAHHVDLRYSTKEDPQWLTETRQKEMDIIRGWISEYKQDYVSLES